MENSDIYTAQTDLEKRTADISYQSGLNLCKIQNQQMDPIKNIFFLTQQKASQILREFNFTSVKNKTA